MVIRSLKIQEPALSPKRAVRAPLCCSYTRLIPKTSLASLQTESHANSISPSRGPLTVLRSKSNLSDMFWTRAAPTKFPTLVSVVTALTWYSVINVRRQPVAASIRAPAPCRVATKQHTANSKSRMLVILLPTGSGH